MENPPAATEIDPETAANAAIAAATRQALYQSAFLLLSRPLEDTSPSAAMQLVEDLRPRSDDYARVFTAEYAERAQAFYVPLYLAPRPIEREPNQTVLRLFLASAAELREKGPQDLGFPGGYKDIVEILQPDSLWVHWKYTAPHSSSGIAYDGLTRIGDRWVWFPKPYRFLRKSTAAAVAPPEAPATEQSAPKSAESGQEKEPPQAANIWKE